MTALEAALDEARTHARSKEQKLSVTTKELKAGRAPCLPLQFIFITSHCFRLQQADRILNCADVICLLQMYKRQFSLGAIQPERASCILCMAPC